MIYEKRTADKNKTAIFTRTNCALNSYAQSQSITQSNSDDIPAKDTPAFAKKSSKTKKGRVTSVLLCVLMLSFVLFFAGKPFFSPIAESLKNKFSSLFSKDDGFIFSDSFSPVEARTLYTVEYKTARGINNIPEQDRKNEKPQSTDTDDTLSVTAGQSKNSIYSDGVKYFPITELDLSGDVLSLSNETNLSPDTVSLLEKTPAALENLQVTSEPLVLIIHTHAGECYTKHKEMYPQNEPTRNYEGDNILQIGQQVKEALSDFGINAVHCETMHDKESFINAYSNSAKTVREYFEKYPSIKFVIDIHRDAIIRSDGESIKPVVDIAGQKYAQLMFVVGTDESGYNHPYWQENLSLALNVMQKTNEYYPGLFRSVNLRNVPFNQQLSCGYLLLEAGSNANLKEEALLSARAFAQGLASLIYST